MTWLIFKKKSDILISSHKFEIYVLKEFKCWEELESMILIFEFWNKHQVSGIWKIPESKSHQLQVFGKKSESKTHGIQKIPGSFLCHDLT
jgi:hypothetical protein